MAKVKVIGRQFTVPAGHKIGISEALADDRMHSLKKAGKGFYMTTAPVNFKEGDLLDFDHELTPGLLQVLEEVGKPKAQPKEPDLPPPPPAAPAAPAFARIEELKALGDATSDEEKAELEQLLAGINSIPPEA